jgi:signal transduction histidine kinase
VIHSHLCAQNTSITALKDSLLTPNLPDTTYIDILNSISGIYVDTYPDSSFSYINEALKKSQLISYLKGEVSASIYQVVAYRLTGNKVENLKTLERAISLVENSNSDQLKASVYLVAGLQREREGKIPESLEYLNQTVYHANKVKDYATLSSAYNNLGITYLSVKNYEKALSNLEKALALDREKEGGDLALAMRLSNIGSVYKAKEDYDNALNYYHQSLSICEALEIHRGIAINLTNIGVITYLYKKDYNKGEEIIKRSIKIAEDNNFKSIRIESLGALADIYFRQGQYSKAEDHVKEAIDIALDIGYFAALIKGAELLDAIYAKTGNYKLAYENHKQLLQYKDSIFNEEDTKKLASLESEYKFKNIQDSLEFANKQELLKVNEALKRKELSQNFTIGVLLIILLLLFTLYLLFNQKRIANNRLEIINTNLNELNNEKDEILHIVSHDLRTPFNQLKSLTYLIKDFGLTVEEKDNLFEMMDKSLDNGLKLIGDLLLVNKIESEQEEAIFEDIELKLLLSKITPFFQEAASEKQIELIVNEIPDHNISTIEHYFTRILENLFSNAIKFTDSGKRVFLSATIDDKECIIYVKDEGQGIKEEEVGLLFKKFSKLSSRPTNNEDSIGLGLAIVKQLAQKINADVQVESTWGKGSTFSLRIPLGKVN